MHDFFHQISCPSQKLIIALHIYYVTFAWYHAITRSFEQRVHSVHLSQTHMSIFKWNKHGRMWELSFRLWMTPSFPTIFMLVNSSRILIRLMAIITKWEKFLAGKWQTELDSISLPLCVCVSSKRTEQTDKYENKTQDRRVIKNNVS